MGRRGFHSNMNRSLGDWFWFGGGCFVSLWGRHFVLFVCLFVFFCLFLVVRIFRCLVFPFFLSFFFEGVSLSILIIGEREREREREKGGGGRGEGARER